MQVTNLSARGLATAYISADCDKSMMEFLKENINLFT